MGINKELTLDAVMDNLEEVLSFVDVELEQYECAALVQAVLDLAVEELYTNIASYSYAPETGTCTIKVEITDAPANIIVTFFDHGMPYNPLAKEDPKLDTEISERPIGGLGFFMVKNSMDEVSYEFRDEQNILTIKKSLESEA